jgi:hypothetical protein
MKELEDFLSSKYRTLSAKNKDLLLQQYKKHKKTDIIILFWLFSFHYAYVGKWKLFFIFFFTLGGILIWWIIDYFRLDTILKEYNEKKALELFENLKKRN